MKLLALIVLLFSTSIFASGGAYYNPERSGEGVSVFVRDQTLSFVFFTYYDDVISLDPVVSPPAPTQPGITCNNQTVWFIGTTHSWDGKEAKGDLLLMRPTEYPYTIDRNLASIVPIGKFSMVPDEEGFDLIIEPNGALPRSMYIFNNRLSFNRAIIE